MDGIEALRCLKNNQMITHDNIKYKYNNKNDTLMKLSEDDLEWSESSEGISFFLEKDGFQVVPMQFNMTFVEALKAMLNGYEVCNSSYPYLIYFIDDGVIKSKNNEGLIYLDSIERNEQLSKWGVIE